ncbi:MAG: hypothetical protein ACYSSI_07770 [Planctomycetota bacterium]|jgi:hypothetical protein
MPSKAAEIFPKRIWAPLADKINIDISIITNLFCPEQLKNQDNILD